MLFLSNASSTTGVTSCFFPLSVSSA